MRSVTSCFNRAIYQKNMLRFWPIWVVYSIILAFMLPLQVLVVDNYAYNTLTENITELLWQMARYNEMGVFFGFTMGICVAMAIYSYLYTSRSACMMHALPIKRSSLFITNYLSGLSMVLLPNLIIAFLTISASVCRGVILPVPVLIWLLLWSASFVFFFSFATFCAMLTGNLFALPAFYVIFNFIIIGLLGILTPIFEIFLYGFNGIDGLAANIVQWLTPVLIFGRAILVVQSFGENGIDDILVAQNFTVLAIYFAVSIAFTLLAYWLYQRHETESAGDIVCIKIVRTIFRYSVGFCGGVSLAILTVAILGLYANRTALIIFTVLWGIVSYFVAEMLLQKSFRVFKAWKGAVLIATLILAFYSSLMFDVYGFQRVVPQSDDVTSVSLSLSTRQSNRSNNIVITDPDTIDQILALHQAIAAASDLAMSYDPTSYDTSSSNTDTSEINYLYLSYYNGNDTILSRHYRNIPIYKADLTSLGSITWALNQLVENPVFIAAELGLTMPENSTLREMEVYPLWNTETKKEESFYLKSEQFQTVLDALLLDYSEGNLPSIPLFPSEIEGYTAYATEITFYLDIPYVHRESVDVIEYDFRNRNDKSSFSVPLTSDMTHTLSALTELDIISEIQFPATRDELNTLYIRD